MSAGFSALNNNGQVLVSQVHKNLHFWKKATYVGQPLTNSVDGYCQIWSYTSDCPNYPVPFFSLISSATMGVSRIYGSPGAWTIEILAGNTGGWLSPGEVYVFAIPTGWTTTQTMGLRVNSDDATPSFDSRFLPLSVTGAASITPPGTIYVHATGGWTNSRSDFTPDQFNDYGAVFTGVTKPIVSYATVAQAERETYFTYRNDTCEVPGLCGSCSVRSWTRYETWWWAFFRGGIRRSGNNLQSGWVAVYNGARTAETGSKGDIFGNSGNSSSGGSWPYTNETLNVGATSVLFSNGELYD